MTEKRAKWLLERIFKKEMTMRLADNQTFLLGDFLGRFFDVLEKDSKGYISNRFSTDTLDELWTLKEDLMNDIKTKKGEAVAAMF
jgi:hypothetical protein